jgi:hypothetical protein
MMRFIKQGLPAKYSSIGFGVNQAAARQRLQLTAHLTAPAWIAGQARNDKGEKNTFQQCAR